ncbi:hypothetical protein WT72_08710 [Burkholderia pseudomultivorans]|uniref:Uncharacterized protein n=1 Tax=Burkholderia cenocepacia TaxID=95486 RepID=A0AAN0RXB6_9BURK|nr:hypothetical protein [Burkholderia pseudomultivorans]AIO35895.1 hypothetical protein DM39_5411 [Burkholderia cenocepacia]KWI60350.1 hypothetical protein WT72_08710 [Burkholderia pseudomultivorans]
MAGTTTGSGTGAQAKQARGLVALDELADMLRQLGAESAESGDAPINVAPFVDGLKVVSNHIHRMKPLDAEGRELAARHYYAGVFAGACGDDSAVACGVAGRLAQQTGGASPASVRRFAMLARVGRRHGRAFALYSGRRVHA